MSYTGIYVSELSFSKHAYENYHFCKGNNNNRKTRLVIIEKGSGTYTYLNSKLKVNEGDVFFIPDNVYCYSEWHGSPEIRVMCVSCFMHCESFKYEPQIVTCDHETKENLLEISRLLSSGYLEELEAYSLFYRVLRKILPHMVKSNIPANKTLRTAIAYITDNWNKDFTIGDVAKECCISESTLYHLFQKELGQTPIKLLNSIKINHAIEYLEKSKYSIATISHLVCFNSENHFRKVFFDFMGMTPMKFRKKS